MKLSDYVIEFLAANGAGSVFEVCGGATTHLLDSLYGRKGISVVSMHHEQAAAFAAEGYSRIGENVAVAMATSGPGATNLITGIASCYFDSIPCLFITGQVNAYEFKFDKPVRQVGFQETDIVNIVRPIVKSAMLVTDPATIRYDLEKALFTARSGRPGPVLVDIPMNVQRSNVDRLRLKPFRGRHETGDSVNKAVKRVKGLIGSSRRPVILAGGGVRLSHATGELLRFVRATGIPVVSSLMGLDAFPHTDPAFAGMIGTYGNRFANLAVANADLVMALGTRLDTRQTGTRPETFARGAKIVHVDIDKNELGHKVSSDIPVHSDIREFLIKLNDSICDYDRTRIRPWVSRVGEYRRRYSSGGSLSGNRITPEFLMRRLSAYLPDDAVICADVGQNQMWSAQYLNIRASQRFITQGGMGAMGSALSMAIGASFADPDRPVVVITGDGGFQLNIQELQTVAHYDLPIKIVLLNNHCYGMVRQFQKQYFNSRFQSTVVGYSSPDFINVVSAYGIPSKKICRPGEAGGALKKLFDGPQAMFLEVDIKQDNLVLPKLSVNRPVEDQEPLLSRRELKSCMCVDILK
ncbi:MAG: thiamine pyrophosphate-binding protein [Candidatus Omnitrophica bacterium]|nr:thiamine pyrophosphate-binding protein [Candidatus Omnitrophota bacterium]